MSEPATPRPDAVVIGRNEGERLRRCIESLRATVDCLVYVDSGSSDGSVAMARSLGASVVVLDPTLPFTAARARNAGIERLGTLRPHSTVVQVVDGDCEVVAGWLQAALAAIRQHPEVAIVCGRRRERYRNRTRYNRLCDMEWQQPIGATGACGGDALIRLAAFRTVGGFDPTLIAGEEPELCFRLRQQGWQILRIDHDMTLHDAAMTRFSQFFRRTVRAGHAYAENAWLHGRSAERHNVRNVVSSIFWGLTLPGFASALAWSSHGLTLLLLPAGYGVLLARLYRSRRRLGNSRTDAGLYATFIGLAKFIEPLGMALFFWRRRVLRKHPALIEYKHPV